MHDSGITVGGDLTVDHGEVTDVVRAQAAGRRPSGVDVLIITALPMEYDAMRQVLGPSGWVDHGTGGPEPFARTEDGGLSVALARPSQMGGRNTAPIATALTDRLRPACLAMSGVCAGRPGATAPGDVVVASPAYQWDEGKYTGDVFRPDAQQFPLDSRWVRAVQDFDPSGLPSHGTATDEEAKVWYLERLLKGQDPRTHPARSRYFPPTSWPARLAQWESAGLITWRESTLALTGTGRTLIERTLYVDVDGPERLPLKVMAGPMASGGAVMADPRTWHRLEVGQRDILAVDMEAATVATVAHERQVPHWLVAKGVMDHADLDKDDRFKAFAARASAEVLVALLTGLLTPAAASPPAARPTGAVPGPVKNQVVHRLTYDWQDLADFLGIPSPQVRRFRAGDEPYEVWAWLESRARLADLPDALAAIDRGDLADLLRPHL
jgi:nucleoside phosphorylase